MKLIVDIGNTITKAAIFDGWEIICVRYLKSDELCAILDMGRQYKVSSAIISSVVKLGKNDVGIFDSLDAHVIRLSAATPVPIKNRYSTPETLGNDRLAAVIGANYLMPGRNLAVIDCGTCITYDFIDSDNCYFGGNISPGINMRLKALNAFTSRLPLVSAEGDVPELGDSTETAIRAGVIRGVEYEIKGYMAELSKKYKDLFVFLTGGDLFSFDTMLKNSIFADKFLVLKGLNRILEYNGFR